MPVTKMLSVPVTNLCFSHSASTIIVGFSPRGTRCLQGGESYDDTSKEESDAVDTTIESTDSMSVMSFALCSMRPYRQ